MIINSIIIPVYGNEKLVHNLLESLLPTLDDLCEVIIVDDGDENMKINSSLLPNSVQYISNSVNSGFSITVNRGIDASQGEYVTLINSDILLKDDWLLETRKSFESIPELGMLGAKLVYPDYGRVMHAGVFFGPSFNFLAFRMSEQLDQLVNRSIETQALSDALATIPKKALLSVGKYDEEYSTSVEDLDMCFRLKEIGLKIVYNPKIVGYHKTAASKEDRYKQVGRDTERFFRIWKDQIEDDRSRIFDLSVRRGIQSKNNLPKEAYLVNLNRKNTKETLDSFLELSDIKIISLFDYSDYVINTPKYIQKTKIDLLDILPFSHLRLRYPIIYIVDFFTSLEDNFYWSLNRLNSDDLVFDHGFNLFYLREITN